MTWNETHERIRIIRAVEAAAAADMTGALPWREEWGTYYDGPAGLVTALRARWNHMCEAQLDDRFGEDDLQVTYNRMRRTQAGVLAIIKAADAGALRTVPVARRPRGGRAEQRAARRRVFRFHGGPTLPV